MIPARAASLRVVLLACAALAAAGCSAPTVSASTPGGALRLNEEVAIFAGGCFWTMETKFDHVPGVTDVIAGVTGGGDGPPTVESFAEGRTGHVEAVQVRFDRSRISYRRLVDLFWSMIDPTDPGGQACDRGANYATAVFATPSQRVDAEASRDAAAAQLGAARLVTPIRAVAAFWPAPPDSQDFARLHAERYRRYDEGCGRAARLRAIWGEAHAAR